jgi:hypothetical protein
MNLYRLALFAHVLGVLGLFIGMGLQWTIVLRLRRAQTVAQLREWSSVVGGVGKLTLVSGALTLGAGLYMTLVAWSWRTPWIVVSLAAMLVMIALGAGVTARRLQAVKRAAVGVSNEAISPDLHLRIRDPRLWIATQLTGGTALGVVFLMTTKPDLGGSLLALAAALILGSVVGGLGARPRRASQPAEAAATSA